MPVHVEFYCDNCRARIFGAPPYSRNTSKHGHQVVCSVRCRDALRERDRVEPAT